MKRENRCNSLINLAMVQLMRTVMRAARRNKMQIYDKRLDEIKPYENNPRHNDNAVDAVANSIRVI